MAIGWSDNVERHGASVKARCSATPLRLAENYTGFTRYYLDASIVRTYAPTTTDKRGAEMVSEDRPRTYEKAESSTRICQLLHIPGFGQDWHIALADPDWLVEFCDLYELGGLNDDEKFALMKLI